MKVIFTIFILMMMLNSNSITINVPEDYSTIQEGITASANGDTVLVQPGIYLENINFEDKNILLTSLYHTTQDTSYISSTVIDGNQNGTVVYISDNETSDSVLKGFTITNGYSSTNAGGIWIFHASLSMENLKVINNTSHAFGGGICCHWSTASLIDSEVRDNISETASGGGILANYTTLNIENMKLTGNQVLDGWGGGGIYSEEAEIHISNSLIRDNYASGYGGAIYVNCSEILEITNTEICNNEAGVWGGAICTFYVDLILNKVCMHHNTTVEKGGGIFSYEANVVMQNVTLADNSAEDGSAIAIHSNSNIVILNTIIADNPGETPFYYNDEGWIGAAYSDIEDYETCNIIEVLDNVIDEDPMFLDDPTGEYFLHVNSPCHDTGTDWFSFTHSVWSFELVVDDYMGLAPDMGAYEYYEVNEESGDEIVEAGMKLSCYPNPFNPETMICFCLEESEQVDLRVYNIKGEIVRYLYAGESSGEQKILWNGRDNRGNEVSSGIYLVSLKAGELNICNKVVLVK